MIAHEQPLRARRRAGGRRAARAGLQPAVPLRAARNRQDPPAAGDRATTYRTHDAAADGCATRPPRRSPASFRHALQTSAISDLQAPLSLGSTCCSSTTSHFLNNKKRSAEEFLFTIDELIGSGAQVVLSGDRPPAAMPFLGRPPAGATSRAGSWSSSSSPDRAARLAILRKRAPQTRSDRAGQRRCSSYLARARHRQHPHARGRARPRPRLRLPDPAADHDRAGRARARQPPGRPAQRPDALRRDALRSSGSRPTFHALSSSARATSPRPNAAARSSMLARSPCTSAAS